MNLKLFSIYTLIGSAIWNCCLASLGYKAGEHWDVLHKYFQKLDVAIASVDTQNRPLIDTAKPAIN